MICKLIVMVEITLNERKCDKGRKCEAGHVKSEQVSYKGDN